MRAQNVILQFQRKNYPLILSIFLEQNILFPGTYFSKGIRNQYGPGYMYNRAMTVVEFHSEAGEFQ